MIKSRLCTKTQGPACSKPLCPPSTLHIPAMLESFSVSQIFSACFGFQGFCICCTFCLKSSPYRWSRAEFLALSLGWEQGNNALWCLFTTMHQALITSLHSISYILLTLFLHYVSNRMLAPSKKRGATFMPKWLQCLGYIVTQRSIQHIGIEQVNSIE